MRVAHMSLVAFVTAMPEVNIVFVYITTLIYYKSVIQRLNVVFALLLQSTQLNCWSVRPR